MAEDEFPCSKIKEVNIIHKGNWINTFLIKYKDPLGVERELEACGYHKEHADASIPDSVDVIAVLKRNLHHNCFVLVQQFRPAVGCFCIEFPAGLVNKEDENVQAAALRELREETGYVGTVVEGEHLELPTSLDPGCEISTSTAVHVVIDGDDPRNVNSGQHLNDDEFIKVLLIPVRELLPRLNQYVLNKKEKYIIDSRLYSFAAGLNMGASLNSFDKPIFGKQYHYNVIRYAYLTLKYNISVFKILKLQLLK